MGSSHGPCPLRAESFPLSSGEITTLKAEDPCLNDGVGLGTAPLIHHTMSTYEGALVLHKQEPKCCQYDGV